MLAAQPKPIQITA